MSGRVRHPTVLGRHRVFLRTRGRILRSEEKLQTGRAFWFNEKSIIATEICFLQHLRPIESHSHCTKNSWNIETMCNKTFASTLTLTHLSLFFSSHCTLSSQPKKPARTLFNAFECSPLYFNLHVPASPHPHHVVPSAILQALNGNPCNLIAAGLIYPQNVTTPINTQTIFIT